MLFGQSTVSCDPKNRYILIEKMTRVANDMTSALIGATLTKFIRDVYTGLLFINTKHNLVFCDLSLNNVGLCDNNFKLFDFGSVKVCGTKIINPKNANKLFCSIYFHTSAGAEITPVFTDDLNSLFYVFTGLCVRLPWAYMSFAEDTPEDVIDYTIGFIKSQYYPKLSLEHKQLWPLDIDHLKFYFGLRYSPKKK